MKEYNEKKFNIPDLKGISRKNIEEHLKLYSGYVKNTNLILQKIEEFGQHRFSFEWNGMRNHEYYFHSLENGHKELSENSELKKEIAKEFGGFDDWLTRFKSVALTRGVGWAMLYYDSQEKKLLNVWVDEQHLGHLNSCHYIVGIDMWEHAYVYDYPTSEKKKYVEAFFENLNWEVIEKNFRGAIKQ